MIEPLRKARIEPTLTSEAPEAEPTAVPATATPPPDAPPARADSAFAARRIQNRALVCLAILGCFYAAYLAAAVIVPIVFSVLASLTLAPLVRALGRLRIGRGLATLASIVLVVAVAAGLFALFRDPAQAVLERMPVAVEHVEHRVQELRRPLRAATKATETLMNLTENDPAKNAVRVVVPTPSPIGYVLKQLPTIVTSMIASVFLTFLFLLHGEDLLRKLIGLMPARESQRRLVAGTREAQFELSRYLLSISLINVCLGLATAAALGALGIDDPLLWGGVVALLNFAPYIGPATSAALLLLAGFADQTSTMQALEAPGIFLLLHLLESQLVTPHLVGRQLRLDPVVIFLALMIFGWLWGILGLLMAVPILACLKVLAQRLDGGQPWAALILATEAEAEAPPAP